MLAEQYGVVGNEQMLRGGENDQPAAGGKFGGFCYFRVFDGNKSCIFVTANRVGLHSKTANTQVQGFRVLLQQLIFHMGHALHSEHAQLFPFFLFWSRAILEPVTWSFNFPPHWGCLFASRAVGSDLTILFLKKLCFKCKRFLSLFVWEY